MSKFIPGQRWVSDSEPELGLGIVLEAGFRDVKVRFPAADETRLYMQRSAPLRRAKLGKGDRARGRAGEQFVVLTVEENAGLLTYIGKTPAGGRQVLPEGDLLDRLSFSDPDKRLLAGQVSKPRTFSLRLRTLQLLRDMLGSPVRGLAGARMELLPHQIAIAHEVASRHNPRVLLADEVGLGKTIEAGLIFHRLHATGQINRVVVAVPSQLVHQWMVELYRRFHHLFTVLDEESCRAEEKGDATKNPFALRSLILCPVDFFSAQGSGGRRVEQAVAAGIDLLIVDEAHHLQWSPEKASPAYTAVERLARAARGVLLLTATPIQLGQAGHFGRLRLLDPDRFSDFGAYLEEAKHYESLAGWADALLDSDAPRPDVADGLRAAFPRDKALHARLAEYLAGTAGAREKLVEDLVDRHGTGRLMFRNRRQAMGGFPARVLHPVPLGAPPEQQEFFNALFPGPAGAPASAFPSEASLMKYLSGAPAFVASDLPGYTGDAVELLQRVWRRDARLHWLAEFLKTHPGEKVLLLCAQKTVVFALQDILPTLTTATFTSFHENLTMTTRDKNAAWFAQADGAQLLISSEIGSEGRNFQFAKHLVLFDLPLDPSVLEQRIGRLDRIGRHGDVQIHVPYLRGTPQETVFRWYHEGFDAFRQTVLGSDTFHELLIGKVLGAAREGSEAAVTELIRETRETAAHVRETLEKGRDRLLEINSNRAGLASGLISEIRKTDADPRLEEYLEEVFDHFGLESQETTVKRGRLVMPAERMLLDAFPGVPEEGLVLTYDRGEALAREEIAFLSIDHPITRTAVDLMLEGEDGTAGFVEWRDAPRTEGRRGGGVALEAVFVLSATAPGALHLDRFLPPTPIRVLVDQEGESLGHLFKELDEAELEMAPTGLLEEHHELFEPLLPKLIDAAQEHAAYKMSMLKKEAHQEAEARLLSEFDRLCNLRAVNPAVSEAEVLLAESRAERVLACIAQADLRLDSVRLILMGKSGIGDR